MGRFNGELLCDFSTVYNQSVGPPACLSDACSVCPVVCACGSGISVFSTNLQ